MKTTRNATTERLEGRVLMSFSTADTFQLSSGHSAQTTALIGDAAGDTFAIGFANNASDVAVGVIREKAAGASTWSTVNSFSYAAGKGTQFWGAAMGPDGALYVSGLGTDSAGNRHWVTLKRGDTGLSAVDDFTTSGGAQAGKISVDGAGDVFVTGDADTVQGNGAKRTTTINGAVRRRLAGQSSFITVDTYTGGADGVTTVAGGPAAGVYVTGYDSGTHWIVRKSPDAGNTWATVDSFQLAPNAGSTMGHAVTADSGGNLFVAGVASAPSNLNFHWVVRKSSDGGTTWSTSDNYRLDAAKNAVATGAGLDAAGNVYVTGYGIDGANVRHAILRTNVGGAWSTADDFQSGAAATSAAFATDAAGNLYVAGNGQAANGTAQWFVRESPAAPPAQTTATAIFSATPLSPAIRRHYRPPQSLLMP